MPNHTPEFQAAPALAPAPVRRVDAFWFWLKLGFISFGGPAGQIALLHQEVVVRRRWLSERRFLHALNYCMVLPGPEAQQLVTYIGWLMHKRWGGVVAGLLFVLPSLCILIAVSWVYMVLGDLPWVAAVLWGIKPAVAAIVLQAVHRMGTRTLNNRWLWGMAAVSFAATVTQALPFPVIVLGAATLGYWGARRWPQAFQASSAHAAAQASHGPAWLDDHTPAPAHARLSGLRLAQVLGVGALLWAVPMGLLVAVWGWAQGFAPMGWFFTKAALLTFGGAYAVLPYVYQGAVSTFAWVSPLQMMDGLALGETTPGPLIMVVAFVAFIGGYSQALLGPEHLVAAGALAACVATWFTFLPSFIFILAGGPWVEHTHKQPQLSAPLTAITAAVVGVVLHLALFFGYHVLWPAGLAGALDGRSALLAVAAAVALLKYKRSVMSVIVMCALAGLALHWLKR